MGRVVSAFLDGQETQFGLFFYDYDLISSSSVYDIMTKMEDWNKE